MSTRLASSAGAIRSLAPFAALAATLLAACSDPAGLDDGRVLRPGVYVLASIDAEPLPRFDLTNAMTVVAETLFVVSPTRYVVAGRYDHRSGGDSYTVRDTATVGEDAVAGGATLAELAGSYTASVTAATPDSIVAMVGTPSSAGEMALVYRASPPPPAPGPIASLQLRATDTAVVHGARIDLRSFVVRGLDATGRWIASPTVTVVPPTGWTVDAGALIAPTRDERGTARLVAGGASVDVRVDAVPDLRASRWSLAFSCVEASVANAPQLGDSATFALAVDSVRYAPTVGPPFDAYPFMDGGRPYSRPWGRAALFARGTRTVWSGGVATTSEFVRAFNVASQRADAVSIVPPAPVHTSGPPSPAIRFDRTADAARAYVAPAGPATPTDDHFCRALAYRRTGQVRLAEAPPG